MRVLAFDTATPATSVALAGAERRDDPPSGARPNHTNRLLGLIEEVMDETGLGWTEVDRIAVGIGPGTFTGLRIGIATAHALARSRNLPLVGVSTLQALALPACLGSPEHDVLAVLDARRGEAFVAAWTRETRPGRHAPVIAPAVLDPEGLRRATSELSSGGLAVGDGAVKFAADLGRSGLTVPPADSELHRVSALALGRLAADLEPGDSARVQPEYLRQPDAEIAHRK